MSILVTDCGFATATDPGPIVPLADLAHHHGALDLVATDDPALLADVLPDLHLIRVAFPSFSDGRGFTIARRLREMGYIGRLRAFGHVLADQYAMARRVGFDEVEIDDDLAARQPADQWRARADWQAHDYQSRLRGSVWGFHKGLRHVFKPQDIITEVLPCPTDCPTRRSRRTCPTPKP